MASILGYVLFVLILLTILHVVYEGAILPNIRMVTRYKLFALRDRLRRIKIIEGERLDDATFGVVDDALNGALILLPVINVTSFTRSVKIFHDHDDLRKKAERRARLVAECEIEEVKEIAHRVSKYLTQTLIWNTLLISLAVLPFFLLISGLRAWGKQTIMILTFVKDGQMRKQTLQFAFAGDAQVTVPME